MDYIDKLILGAGPAGLAVELELNKAGKKFIIIIINILMII